MNVASHFPLFIISRFVYPDDFFSSCQVPAGFFRIEWAEQDRKICSGTLTQNAIFPEQADIVPFFPKFLVMPSIRIDPGRAEQNPFSPVVRMWGQAFKEPPEFLFSDFRLSLSGNDKILIANMFFRMFEPLNQFGSLQGFRWNPQAHPEPTR
jgi:hypothetical protein